VVALLAVIIVRGGFVEALPGVVVLLAALALAGLAILLAFAATVVIWNNGNPGFSRALTGAFIGVVLLAYPGFVVAQGYGLPQLSDVSTDTNDPPRFEAIARVRPREANPIAYPGATAAAMQRLAYPEITPITASASPDDSFKAVMAVIKKRKWTVIEERTPQGGRRDAHIEAVARTPIMGFREDVAIRIRRTEDGSVIDIRSASRYGKTDFGSNARRIMALSDDIEDEISNQTAPANR
jgi:uncharacterized protein (DUF1499 family)